MLGKQTSIAMTRSAAGREMRLLRMITPEVYRTSMMMRAFGVWVLIVPIAIINGGIRQGLISPRTGDTAGRAISTVMRCAAILMLSWLTIGGMRPTTARDVWSIGALWVTLTLAFEFLAGHFVFGTPSRELLADSNVFRGRIWVLVLITTATAPWLAAQRRGLLPHLPGS